MLHEKDGFDRRFPMSIQESINKLLIERVRVDFWPVTLPPIGFMSAVMKPDTTKLTRVGEDKRAFALE